MASLRVHIQILQQTLIGLILAEGSHRLVSVVVTKISGFQRFSGKYKNFEIRTDTDILQQILIGKRIPHFRDLSGNILGTLGFIDIDKLQQTLD